MESTATAALARRWSLAGRTALVTGASRGIGLAIARELLGLGAGVLMVARNEDALDAAVDELAQEFPAQLVAGCTADLAEPAGRAELVAWLEDSGFELHLLVNNVGNNRPAATLATSDADLDWILRTNVLSAFDLCRRLHPWLTVHGSAAIVNVASVSGLTHVRTGAAYGLSKAAIVQLTRNLACEWAVDGIRVNAVAPWYIRTDRTHDALSNPAYLEEVLARTPLGRIGEPADVAAAVAFLCLPAAGYITGECIAVDGGFLRYGF
jgi:Tropinone reductase 1